MDAVGIDLRVSDSFSVGRVELDRLGGCQPKFSRAKNSSDAPAAQRLMPLLNSSQFDEMSMPMRRPPSSAIQSLLATRLTVDHKKGGLMAALPVGFELYFASTKRLGATRDPRLFALLQSPRHASARLNLGRLCPNRAQS